VVLSQIRKSDFWLELARRSLVLVFPLLTLGTALLLYLLLTGHFEIEYVYSVTSMETPLYLRATALWGGQAGSLVLWAWLMAGFSAAVTFRNWKSDQELLPWVILVSSITLAFFLLLTVFYENPFRQWWQTPAGEIVARTLPPAGAVAVKPLDGQGLNPLLRHPGMILHPPLLYLGFVSFVIPFSFAIATLITGKTDDHWIRLSHH
jgi:cytochrome c-type biogenesis protein CcmF